MEIFMVQPWQQITRHRVTQSFSASPEVSFPPLANSEGKESPIVIEAKVEGHLIHRISSSLYNGIISRLGLRKIQGVPSIAHGLLKFLIGGGIVKLCINITTPEEFRMVAKASNQVRPEEPMAAKGIKVAIHREYPEQTETVSQDRRPKSHSETPIKYSRRVSAHKAEKHRTCTEPKQIHPRGSYQDRKSSNNRRGALPKLDLEPSHDKDIRWELKEAVDKAFKKQTGRILEVYVDDLVIKSHTEQEILRDIEETFQTLRNINMKINLKKCTFSVEEGMFLGHVVNMKGIKACPEKVEAVIKLQSPRTLKELQSLNGKLPKNTRRMLKWTFKLDDITYRLRKSIHGQVLADFIVERLEEDVCRPVQAEYMVRGIHKGSCSMHSRPRSVVAKAAKLGYYWLTMHKDARNIIRKCDVCQVRLPVPKNPQQKLIC
nr:reverse transcriptase domain-containing protein [Tanacetum cinerariifolium]